MALAGPFTTISWTQRGSKLQVGSGAPVAGMNEEIHWFLAIRRTFPVHLQHMYHEMRM